MQDKFIFVHIPKTAGTTFIRILEFLYSGRTGRDYKDKKGKKGNYVDEMGVDACDVIYGHFTAEKYKYLNRPQITFVRDPVERLISEYYHKPNNAHDILDYIDNKEIYGRPEVKSVNLIYDYVLDTSNFDLILLQEYFDDSIKIFSEWAGVELPENYYSRKVNNNKDEVSVEVKKELEKRLEKDYEIYNEVLNLWGIL